MKKLEYFILGLLLGIVISCSGKAFAFRIQRPETFTLPWTKPQVAKLNATLEDLWNLQNGEFNLDIVTTNKSSASNGDFWIWNDGGTYKLQVQAGDAVRSVTLTP